ncbi:MAG: OmpH family outer membrane protein [Planctomycetota bacterium]
MTHANEIWRWSVVVALLLVAGVGWRLSERSATAAMAARPSHVATIELANVLDQLDEKSVRERELQGEIDGRKARVESLAERVQQLQDQLNVVQGTSEAAGVAERFLLAQAELRAEQEISQAIVESRKKSFELEFFNRIREAAQVYAEREGYDLVITSDASRMIRPELPTQQVQVLIGSHRVLYASDATDITNAVAVYMNNQFRAGGGN